MEEELVNNTIKSIYTQKPKLLSSIERNNIKINTSYRPRITNYLKELKNLDDASIEMTTENKDFNNNFNKDRNINRKKFKTLNKKVRHSFLKNNKIKPFHIEDEKEDLKVSKEHLIKKDKTVYLLRKLYIILPNDKMKNYKDIYSKLNFDFYFPTEIKSKRVIEYIGSGQKGDIICANLKDIFLEVYKHLKLSIRDFVKLEIYDGNLRPIKLESQLIINKVRIIYVKISYVSDEKINLWKQRLKSRMLYHNFFYLNKNIPELIKVNYIYNDEYTEIYPEDSKNKENISDLKSKSKKSIDKRKNCNSNNNTIESDNSTKFNTISQITGRKKLNEKLKIDLKEIDNKRIIFSSEKKPINLNSENKIKISEEPPYNNRYLRTFNKIHEQKEEKRKIKIKKNVYDIFKKNGYKKNTLLSPFLFNFDVTDVINNKYVLKYLTNKNRDKKQEKRIEFRNKFEIKTLSIEDSNSKREKKPNIITNIKTSLINKNIKGNSENSLLEKNKRLLCELNTKIKEFVDSNIDSLVSDEEIEDFKYFSCNYVLINEFKDFPLLQLKKKYAFFVYLSLKMVSNYEKLYTNINSVNDFLENILKNEEFENSLVYLNRIYNNIIKRKNFLIGYLRAINIELNISFPFFLLFIVYNKSLFFKKIENSLIYISLDCADISINSEINFQQYCDFNLLIKRNDFISYNKKFNFVKDLILRLLMNERFNTKNSIKKLKIIFSDINFNKLKQILSTDMCSVKSKKNIDTYNYISEIYEEYLNYMENGT